MKMKNRSSSHRKIIKRENNSFLRCLFPIVDCIADLFGPHCEVALHDIEVPEHSIIKIRNGHITGREAGDPMTDVGFEMIKKAADGMEVLGNYNHNSGNGLLLKSNAINIRDLNNKHVGILCINLEVGHFKQMEQLLQQVSQEIDALYSVKENQATKIKEEHFDSDIWSITEKVIGDAIQQRGKPAEAFSKEDRLTLIKELENKGLFYARGAIHQVGKALGLSKPSIYRYLEELHMMNRKEASENQSR
jgi:predicted transcriptional regulator YheO